MAAGEARREGKGEPSVADVLEWAQEERVDFINMQFTDVMGIVKSVTMPLAELEDALTNGVWFDGSAIDGFARAAESDMFLLPDRSTFTIIPWEKGGPRDRAPDLRCLQAERRSLSPAIRAAR